MRSREVKDRATALWRTGNFLTQRQLYQFLRDQYIDQLPDGDKNVDAEDEVQFPPFSAFRRWIPSDERGSGNAEDNEQAKQDEIKAGFVRLGCPPEQVMKEVITLLQSPKANEKNMGIMRYLEMTGLKTARPEKKGDSGDENGPLLVLPDNGRDSK